MWILAIIMLLPLSVDPVLGRESSTAIAPYPTLDECETEGRRIWSDMDSVYTLEERAQYKFACINRLTKRGRIIERGEPDNGNLGETQS